MEKITQLALSDRLQEYIKYDIRNVDDSIVIDFIPKYHNCNLYGHCHGGILMTLADNCMYATYCYNLEMRGTKCLPIPQNVVVYTKNMSYSFRRNALVDSAIMFIGSISGTKTSCLIMQDGKTIGYASGEYSTLTTSKL